MGVKMGLFELISSPTYRGKLTMEILEEAPMRVFTRLGVANGEVGLGWRQGL